MALLEAMASGIPAIVTAVGGNPEVITHNTTGWVIPSDSTKDLIEAINQAYRSPEKRTRMADVARNDFETRFSFIEMIKNYRSLYVNLLTTGGKK